MTNSPFRNLAFSFAFILLYSASLASAQDHQPRRAFELRADSPEFWKLVARDTKLETVATVFGFTEGPVWDKSGFPYVSDEEINKIFHVYPDGHKEELIALGDPDGKRFYVDDSEQRNIRVYDFSPEATLMNGRIFGEEPGGKDDGVPDGIKVDGSGTKMAVTSERW